MKPQQMKRIFSQSILTLFLLSAFQPGFSQEKADIEVKGEFNGVTVLNYIDLVIEKGEEASLSAFGERANEVLAIVDEGILQIQQPYSRRGGSKRKSKNEPKTNIKVVLKYKDSIRYLEARNGSSIHVEYPLEHVELNIAAHGESSLDINAECDRLNVSLSGKSIADVAGDTVLQNIETKGKSTYKAINLNCEQADVVAGSGSEVHLEVSKLINAKATSSSSVVIYSKPKVLNKKSSFGGSVILIDE